MRFVKMHGIGNDYVYLDAVSEPALEARSDLPELARRMSDRHRGVGSDGLILICRPQPGVAADVRMRMFNADGSEAEMCGNGVRCVAKFAHDRLGVHAKPMRVETGTGVLSINYTLREAKLVEATVDMGQPVLSASEIPVDLPRPTDSGGVVDFPLDKYIPLRLPGALLEDCLLDPRMTCVSMGNPHAVIFCGCVAGVPLETIGPFLERQNIFPKRINSHFVQTNGSREATMRTWERGAGGTMACGTGACAVAVAGALTGRLERNVLLHLPGGDLRIGWDERSNHVFMTGPAEEVFEGEWPE
jgi:diaminopimelate epimerase